MSQRTIVAEQAYYAMHPCILQGNQIADFELIAQLTIALLSLSLSKIELESQVMLVF